MDLCSTNIKDSDAFKLARAENLNKLEYLDLGYNSITQRGAKELIQSAVFVKESI